MELIKVDGLDAWTDGESIILGQDKPTGETCIIAVPAATVSADWLAAAGLRLATEAEAKALSASAPAGLAQEIGAEDPVDAAVSVDMDATAEAQPEPASAPQDSGPTPEPRRGRR